MSCLWKAYVVILYFSLDTLRNSFIVGEDIFEFCGDNQIFSFSRQACPGGVLFKEPMELTEPCHCINKQFTLYSCKSQSLSNNQTGFFPEKVCHRRSDTVKRQGTIAVKLLQPSGLSSNNGAKDPICKASRASCARLPINSFHGQSDVGDFQGSETELQNGTNHDRKRRALDTTSSFAHLTDERLRKRIEDTIKHLNKIQFGSEAEEGKVQPKSMSLRVLAKTVKIFNNIAPPVIIEEETLVSILQLFLEKYLNLELPGYSGKLFVDDLIKEQSYLEVMDKLNECTSQSSDSSQRLEFLTTPGLCPCEITHVIHRTQSQNYGFKKTRHELGKMMPDDRKYQVDKEDFILGALWKVFDTVYSYCFPYTFSYLNAQILVNYHNIIENIFTSPWVYPDYNVDGGTSMYASRIEHEDLSVLMKNLDLMDEAVHILSKFKPFFVKPLSEYKGSGASAFSDNAKSNKRSKRQRRNSQVDSSSNGVDWSTLEIWGGRAYCLQKSNPEAQASVANVDPNIDNLLC